MCYQNKLEKISKLNNNLEELYCNYNELILLPKLNDKLQILLCNDNKLHLFTFQTPSLKYPPTGSASVLSFLTIILNFFK